jgi:hypothetical protein
VCSLVVVDLLQVDSVVQVLQEGGLVVVQLVVIRPLVLVVAPSVLAVAPLVLAVGTRVLLVHRVHVLLDHLLLLDLGPVGSQVLVEQLVVVPMLVGALHVDVR